MLGIFSPLSNIFRGAYYFARMLTSPKRRGFYAAHFLNSVEGQTVWRSFDRFASLDSSRELLGSMPSSGALLSDRAVLGAGAADTLGHIYLDFMISTGFSSDYISGLAEMFSRLRSEDEQRAWFRRHVAVAHDLRHVISGYGATPRGEYCNLCFTFGQTGHPGVACLAMLAAAHVLAGGDLGFLRAGLEAFRRGRGSTLIDLLPWELCLGVPLATCREALGLRPPKHFADHIGPNAYDAEGASARIDSVQRLAAVLAPA